MRHIYTGIDIGSDTIKIIVCELYSGRLNVLACTSTKSKGIKRGLITNVNEASASLKEALNEIESMLGVKIKKALVSVPTYFADFNFVKSEIKIDNEEHIITSNDISQVISATTLNVNNGKETVAILPIDFKVDDKVTSNSPINMKGEVLGVRAIIASTPRKNVYSVLKLLESNGIEVVDISLNSIGDMFSFKNKDNESKLGAIINIGADTTTVSIYNKAVIVKSSIIAIGGSAIDNDISYVYKVDLKNARKLKEKFALAYKRHANVSEICEVDTTYDEKIKINQFEISELVERRTEEILKLAKKELNILTNKELQYIIITGGTSNLQDLQYLADEVFTKMARITDLKMIGIRNNKYSSSVGNIVYYITKLKLREKKYSMFSESDADELVSVKKNKQMTNESMLGKVFGYFFGE